MTKHYLLPLMLGYSSSVNGMLIAWHMVKTVMFKDCVMFSGLPPPALLPFSLRIFLGGWAEIFWGCFSSPPPLS